MSAKDFNNPDLDKAVEQLQESVRRIVERYQIRLENLNSTLLKRDEESEHFKFDIEFLKKKYEDILKKEETKFTEEALKIVNSSSESEKELSSIKEHLASSSHDFLVEKLSDRIGKLRRELDTLKRSARDEEHAKLNKSRSAKELEEQLASLGFDDLEHDVTDKIDVQNLCFFVSSECEEKVKKTESTTQNQEANARIGSAKKEVIGDVVGDNMESIIIHDSSDDIQVVDMGEDVKQKNVSIPNPEENSSVSVEVSNSLVTSDQSHSEDKNNIEETDVVSKKSPN